jgi:hypothetical protein
MWFLRFLCHESPEKLDKLLFVVDIYGFSFRD